jgi:hypothetical protein
MANGGETDVTNTNGATVKPKVPATEPKPQKKMTMDEFNALAERAKKDKKSFHRLREAIQSGDYRYQCDVNGNPAWWLRMVLALSLGGNDDKARLLAVPETIDRMQRELAGPDPTPLESLLAERVAMCWFMLNTYEMRYASKDEMTYREAEYQLKRIESANRRFLSAVRTLVQVRTLALPALQVNIGTNQVNVSPAGSQS